MKFHSIITYTSTIVALAGMPLVVQQVRAGATPMLGQVGVQFGGEQQRQYQSSWNDDQRRELRHIFYQLEHADTDYQGHRTAAIREIRHAADEMGMDLQQGSGYSQQSERGQREGGYDEQSDRRESSDNTLRHCRDRLKDLAQNTEDPVRHELYEASHDLDLAVESR